MLSSMLDDSSLWCGADGLVAASGGAAGAVAAEQCDTRRDLIAGGVAQPGVCRCEQRLRLGVRSAHATARRCAAGSMPIRLNMASMRDRTLPTASLTGRLCRSSRRRLGWAAPLRPPCAPTFMRNELSPQDVSDDTAVCVAGCWAEPSTAGARAVAVPRAVVAALMTSNVPVQVPQPYTNILHKCTHDVIRATRSRLA